jgi:hypothetical protein
MSERQATTTETHCHCGAEFNGSDHCSHCFCEQYEAYCDADHAEATSDDCFCRSHNS